MIDSIVGCFSGGNLWKEVVVLSLAERVEGNFLI
jgi:hypothetical protein